jgi:hypothetical protein
LSRSTLRAARISRVPSCANPRAHDLPIPELAPVIRTTLFFNEYMRFLHEESWVFELTAANRGSQVLKAANSIRGLIEGQT